MASLPSSADHIDGPGGNRCAAQVRGIADAVLADLGGENACSDVDRRVGAFREIASRGDREIGA